MYWKSLVSQHTQGTYFAAMKHRYYCRVERAATSLPDPNWLGCPVTSTSHSRGTSLSNTKVQFSLSSGPPHKLMRGILEHLHVFFERAGVCGELPVTSMNFFTLLHSITVWLPTRVICCFNFVKANGSGPSWRIWFALTRFRMTVGWLGENQLTSYDLAPPCPRDSVRLTVGNMCYQNVNQSYYSSCTAQLHCGIPALRNIGRT